MKSIGRRLRLGTSAIALLTTMSLAAGDALAQDQDAAGAQGTEQVVVTGTSIRGITPAGTNLITMSAGDIQATGAATVEAALANTPVINNFGSAGEGQTGIDYYQPSIHNIGASGSNATLVLIDGHLPPTGGTNHSTADPNVIPLGMLERVQVIANGDSSIYGSNAVAGVINFITRSKYDGVQFNAQAGFAGGLTNLTGGVLSGASWEGGNVIFAYQYVDQGRLLASERSFSANPDQTARAMAAGLPVGTAGGSKTNFDSFTGAGPNCSQPLVRVNGSGNYYNMVTGQTYSTNASSAPCNLSGDDTLIEGEIRNNVMMKLKQDFGSNLSVGADLLYAQRQSTTTSGSGTVSAVTVYGAGPQANPFFQLPPGYTGTATKETVYANLDGLLGGPGKYTIDSASDMYADLNAEYRLGDNFAIDALVVAGRDDSPTRGSSLTANSSAVDLALNGTGNSGGSTTSPAIANSTIVPLNLPLTTSNALDIWHPAGSNNQTSAAVISAIQTNPSLTENISSFEQYRLSTNGTLFQLPAGPLKIALGGEAIKYALEEQNVSSNNTGSTKTGANFTVFNFERIVRSAFVEADAPIVSPDMGVPLMQKFEVNASGRYDDYSDFGITTNYKLAFSWDVIDGLKLRGNMSTSFVAPGLDQEGDKYHAFGTIGYGVDTSMDGLAIPVAAYPALTQFAPSQFNNGQACTMASVTCVLASTVQGVSIKHGANPPKPSLGRGWEIGVDFAPDFLPGLLTSVTYWNTEFLGAFTAPTSRVIINNGPLQSLATFYPGAGAAPSVVTDQSVGLLQKSALPPTISYIYTPNVGNWQYLYAHGIDADVSYTFHTDAGDFKVGDALTMLVKYDLAWGNGGVRFNILNTDGVLSAFPTIATNSRTDLGWSNGPFSADLFVNYTGGYRNWSGVSVIPITTNAQGNPSGGGDPVSPNVRLDLHMSYQFDGGVLGNDQVSLTVINLADSDPPFYLGAEGYDGYAGSPIGRLIEVGLTSRF